MLCGIQPTSGMEPISEAMRKEGIQHQLPSPKPAPERSSPDSKEPDTSLELSPQELNDFEVVDRLRSMELTSRNHIRISLIEV